MFLVLLYSITGILILFPAHALPQSDDPETLVKQLASVSFAEREAAQQKLQALREKAKAAVEAGMKNRDPEIASRCQRILQHILFQSIEERYLPRFTRLFGDDEPTRALFAAIVSDPSNVKLIETVEQKPEEVEDLYRYRELALTRSCNIGAGAARRLDPARVSIAEVLGYLYLGTFPGAERVRERPERQFLPQTVDQWKTSDLGIVAALKLEHLQVGARRLLIQWTATRERHPDVAVGRSCALAYNFPEAVQIAKQRLNRMKASKSKVVGEYLPDLALIGKLGSKSDIEYLSSFFGDEGVAGTTPIPGPAEEYDPTTAFRVGKDSATQIRDMAYAMALMLAGRTRQDLDDAGFFFSRFLPRETAEGGKASPPLGNRGRADDPFNCEDIGFIQEDQREAAIKKAREWLAPILKSENR